MKEEYFVCQCGDFDHIFSLTWDEDDGDLYLSAKLVTWRSFWKRLVSAMRYVFKAERNNYDCTLLKRDDYPRIRALLDKAEACARLKGDA